MKRVGIRSKIILLTLLILGGGFFVAPEILEEVAEVRYRRTLEDGRANLAERLEKDYKKLNFRNTPRLGDYFVFIYDKQSGKLIREYSFFPPRLIRNSNRKPQKSPGVAPSTNDVKFFSVKGVISSKFLNFGIWRVWVLKSSRTF